MVLPVKLEREKDECKSMIEEIGNAVGKQGKGTKQLEMGGQM